MRGADAASRDYRRILSLVAPPAPPADAITGNSPLTAEIRMLATVRYFKTIEAYLEDLKKPSRTTQHDYSEVRHLVRLVRPEDRAAADLCRGRGRGQVRQGDRGPAAGDRRVRSAATWWTCRSWNRASRSRRTFTPRRGWGRRLQPGVWLQSNEAEVRAQQQRAGRARHPDPRWTCGATLTTPPRRSRKSCAAVQRRTESDTMFAPLRGGGPPLHASRRREPSMVRDLQHHRRGRVLGAFAFRASPAPRTAARPASPTAPRRWRSAATFRPGRIRMPFRPMFRTRTPCGRPAHVERDAALEAVAPLDRHVQKGLVPRPDDDLVLLRSSSRCRRGRRPSACRRWRRAPLPCRRSWPGQSVSVGPLDGDFASASVHTASAVVIWSASIRDGRRENPAAGRRAERRPARRSRRSARR